MLNIVSSAVCLFVRSAVDRVATDSRRVLLYFKSPNEMALIHIIYLGLTLRRLVAGTILVLFLDLNKGNLNTLRRRPKS